MAPLFIVLLVVVVTLVVAFGLLWAVRTGLWARETSTTHPPDQDLPERGRAGHGTERRFQHEERDAKDEGERPEHVTREDPAKSRTFGA